MNIFTANVYVKDYCSEIILRVVESFNQSTMERPIDTERKIKAVICGGSAINYYMEYSPDLLTNDFDIRFLYIVDQAYPNQEVVNPGIALYEAKNNVVTYLHNELNQFLSQLGRLDQLNEALRELFDCELIPGPTNEYFYISPPASNQGNNVLSSIIFNLIDINRTQHIGNPMVDMSVREIGNNIGILENKTIEQRFQEYNESNHPGGYFKWHLSTNLNIQTIVKVQDRELYIASLGYIFWDTVRMLNVGLKYWSRPAAPADVNDSNKFNRYLDKYLILLKALNQIELLKCGTEPVRRIIQKCSNQTGPIINETFKTDTNMMVLKPSHRSSVLTVVSANPDMLPLLLEGNRIQQQIVRHFTQLLQSLESNLFLSTEQKTQERTRILTEYQSQYDRVSLEYQQHLQQLRYRTQPIVVSSDELVPYVPPSQPQVYVGGAAFQQNSPIYASVDPRAVDYPANSVFGNLDGMNESPPQ